MITVAFKTDERTKNKTTSRRYRINFYFFIVRGEEEEEEEIDACHSRPAARNFISCMPTASLFLILLRIENGVFFLRRGRRFCFYLVSRPAGRTVLLILETRHVKIRDDFDGWQR